MSSPSEETAKRVYDCDKESRETIDRLAASAELQELKVLFESHRDPIMPEAKTSKTSILSEDSLSKTILLSPDESFKVTHVGNSLDFK
jgi:hypothetical protein